MLSSFEHLARFIGLIIRARCFDKLSLTGVLFLVLSVAHAQVANDNIENRRQLRAEETITSSTVGCTVQASCVDERLTGRCIEYHNDQWFEFRPPTAGTYFVNIGGSAAAMCAACRWSCLRACRASRPLIACSRAPP
jgi:hypothetical protein